MSLIAWYKLDQNVLDSINFNNGTIVGVNSVYELGRIDYAIKFTSNDTRVSTPLKLLTEDGKPFSISFWCKKNTTWGGSHVAWVGERVSYTWMFYRLNTWGDGLFSFLVYYLNTSDTYTLEQLNVNFPTTLSIWNHVVITLNGNNRKIYLNGVLSSQSTIADFKSYRVENYTLGIGAQSAQSASYSMNDGVIDDVRVFDHEVSLKEVKDLYRSKVIHLKLDNNPYDNSYGLLGTETNIVYSNESKIGNYCISNADYSSRYIDVGRSPRITLDQTICMWLYPVDSTVRTNPYNKTYGGEGTITMEINRTFNYYWGTNGGNTSPYTSLNSSGNIPLNQWSHIAVTRNLSGDNMVRFYINGTQSNFTTAAYAQAAASTQNLLIGSGYTNPFRGKIDDVRVYATALTSDEINNIIKTRSKLDNIGNFYVEQIKETKYKPFMVNYKEWVVGTQGTQGNFSQNGTTSENYIIEDTDPWGKTVPIWEARPSGDGSADGGWNYSKSNIIDPTKLYRFTTFVRRKVIGNGNFYLGCGGNTVRRLNNSSLDGNPYFRYESLSITDWILIVGYILPYDTTYTINNSYLDSGRYKVSDKSFLGNINFNFKWAENNTTNFIHRSYLFYSSDTSTRQQWVYPRVDLIDGTQPTLDDLLNGFDSYNWDYIKDIDTTKALPLSVSNNKTYISIPSELGPINGMNGYWKFENDTNDLSGNQYNGISTDVTFIKGINGNCGKFNGTTSTISMGDVLNIGLNDRTYSFWFKLINMGADTQWMFSKSDNGATAKRHCIGINTNNKIYVFLSSDPNTTQFNFTGTTNVNDNNWHYLTVIFNRRSNLSVYLDGQLEGTPLDISSEKNIDITLARPFRIGSYNNISDTPILFFNGLIDEFRVYNRVLTQEEVNILYNLYKPTNQQKMILSKDGRVYVKQGFKEV